MLLPILRLFLIYGLLVLVVIGVFNREKIVRLVLGDRPAAVEAETEPAPDTAPVSAPMSEATAGQQPDIASPAPVARPVTSMPAVAKPPSPTSSLPAPESADGGPVFPPTEAEMAAERPAPPALQIPTPSAPSVAEPAAPGPAPSLQGPSPQAKDGPRFPEPPAEPSTQPTTAPPGPGDAAQAATAVEAARAAFWAGDRSAAAAQFVALTEAHPDDPDLAGELGNFYFMERNLPEAARAFLRAGELLIAQGRIGEAMSLVQVLQPIDAEAAAALAQRLPER